MFAIVARAASGNELRPWPKNSTNFPTTLRPRSSSVTRSTRSVPVEPSGSAPDEAHADDLREEHRDRLAEHRRLGLDAANAPAEDAEAVDHRRVRVGADERVGVRGAVAAEHDLREVFEVDLVHDAGAGRHDAEVLERLLAPAQELVALAVALVLALHVVHEREAACRSRPPAPSGR